MKFPLHATLIADGYGQQNDQPCAAGVPLPHTHKYTEWQTETFPSVVRSNRLNRLAGRWNPPTSFSLKGSLEIKRKAAPYPFAGGAALLALLISDPTVTDPRRCIASLQKTREIKLFPGATFHCPITKATLKHYENTTCR